MNFFRRVKTSFNWREWVGPVVLVVVAVLVLWRSWEPNTWLTGWDALHPEFDFGLNLKRVLFGVWRQDQGLGAVAIHSHMSELPRIVMLWMLSLALPVQIVRYVYVGLCFVLGGLGIYVWVRWLTGKWRKSVAMYAAGLVAGLFYMFNLGTVQHFYVVFEMFAVQYAVMGWLFWLVSKYLDKGELRVLLSLLVVGFVSAPMAYAATLWYALFGGVAIYCLSWWIASKRKRVVLKRMMLLLGIWLAAHAFWLLPQVYVLLEGSSSVPTDSRINNLFSSEAYLRNKAFGGLVDTLILRNFLFDWQVFDFEASEFVELLPAWKEHAERWLWLGVGLGVFALSGLVVLVRKSVGVGVGMIGILVLCWVMIANATVPFEWIFEWLRTHFVLVEQGLRFPFTKFSLLLMGVMATGAGVAVWQLSDWVERKVNVWLVGGLVFVMSLGLVVWGYPALSGDFVSEKVQLAIPSEYFELFDQMQELPEGRVVVLPLTSRVGWEYYDWGFQGAGFVWFGMPQSVVVRDFDRWSEHNEALYLQLSRAILGQDEEEVAAILDRFEVDYVLVDEGLISADGVADSGAVELIQLAGELGYELEFESGRLSLFSTGNDQIGSAQQMTQVKNEIAKQRIDVVSELSGDYFERQGDFLWQFPFTTVYTEEPETILWAESDGGASELTLSQDVVAGNIEEVLLPGLAEGFEYRSSAVIGFDDGVVDIKVRPAIELALGEEVMPVYELEEMSVVASETESIVVEFGGRFIELNQGEEVEIDDVVLQVGYPIEIGVYATAEAEAWSLPGTLSALSARECWRRESGLAEVLSEGTEAGIEMTTTDASACLTVRVEDVPAGSELVRAEVAHRSKESALPYFCVTDSLAAERCLHAQVYGVEGGSQDWEVIERYFKVEVGSEYFLDLILRPPTEVGATWSIEYAEPSFESLPLVRRVSFGDDVWEGLMRQKSVAVESQFETIGIRQLVEPVAVALNVNTGDFVENCDLYQRGSVSRQLRSGGRVEYMAVDGAAACESVELTNVTTEREYLLRLEGEHKSGRGLKFYLLNRVTGENDLEVVLDENMFDQSFSVVSWPGLVASNYALSLETRSFGSEESVNALDKVTAYPVNLGWLSRIRVVYASDLEQVGGSDVIDEVGSWGTSHRFWSVAPDELVGEQVVVYDQGFASGWMAYEVENLNCGLGLCKILPWFFGNRLEQVKVNGWANGFIIEDDESSGQSVVSSRQVVVVYWPQYLQWVGFGVLVVVVGMLGVVSVKKGKTPPKIKRGKQVES